MIYLIISPKCAICNLVKPKLEEISKEFGKRMTVLVSVDGQLNNEDDNTKINVADRVPAFPAVIYKGKMYLGSKITEHMEKIFQEENRGL